MGHSVCVREWVVAHMRLGKCVVPLVPDPWPFGWMFGWVAMGGKYGYLGGGWGGGRGE